LLAHGRWFSPGTPASSTTKTGRHDIAEILLKVVLKHQKSNHKIATLDEGLYYKPLDLVLLKEKRRFRLSNVYTAQRVLISNTYIL
jgi:hypothetical protein